MGELQQNRVTYCTTEKVSLPMDLFILPKPMYRIPFEAAAADAKTWFEPINQTENDESVCFSLELAVGVGCVAVDRRAQRLIVLAKTQLERNGWCV